MRAVLVPDFCGYGDAEEGNGLSGCHANEQGAPTEALDEEETGGYSEHEADAVASGEEAGGEGGEADGFGEDKGEVVAEDVDAGELLSRSQYQL